MADDHADMRTYLTTLLSERDQETMSASDCNLGYDVARTLSPDLNTLDIVMERESGVRIDKEILSARPG